MEATFDVDENVQMEIQVPGKDDLILVKSNMMDQFSISANGGRVVMKPQDLRLITLSAFSGVETSVVVMARLGSTVMVNSLGSLLPAGSLT
jgi:hypothetical protein